MNEEEFSALVNRVGFDLSKDQYKETFRLVNEAVKDRELQARGLRNVLQVIRSAPDIAEAAEMARVALLPPSLKPKANQPKCALCQQGEPLPTGICEACADRLSHSHDPRKCSKCNPREEDRLPSFAIRGGGMPLSVEKQKDQPHTCEGCGKVCSSILCQECFDSGDFQ